MGQIRFRSAPPAGGVLSEAVRFASRLAIRLSRRRPSRDRATTLCLATLLLAAGVSFAQQDGDETGELSLMTGAALGGMGTHASVAGSAGVSLTHFIMVAVDAGMMPAGSATLLSAGSSNISGSDLFTFGVALQVKVPIRRWEPYVLLEPAVLVNSYLTDGSTVLEAVTRRGERHSKFGLEGGAGVRYYIKPKWGVRAEYRYISSARNFSEIKMGVFYQLEGYSGFHVLRDLNRFSKYLRDGDRDRLLRETAQR